MERGIATYGYETGTGRFRSINWSAGGQTGNALYGYLNNSDLIEQLTINNSLITTYSYEPNRNLKTQVKNEFNAQLISQYDYNYNSLGLREHSDTSGSAFTGTPIEPTPETSVYSTNSLNQYTQINKDNGQQTTDTLTYDDDGNLTSIISGSSAKVYEYNAENRLIAVRPQTPVNGNTKVEFVYDYMGRRVQKKVYNYESSAYSLQSTRLYVYVGWNMVQEMDGTGVVQKSYIWALDLNQSLQDAGGVGGLLSSIQDQESSSQLFLYDANGNVGQLIDSDDGSIVAHYEYDPFGILLKSYGSKVEGNLFRFSTKYFDIETELGYWGFRYYSADLGRWINRDPLDEAGAVMIGGLKAHDDSSAQSESIRINELTNLYIYVLNNPINAIDPTGLFSIIGNCGSDKTKIQSVVMVACGNLNVITDSKLRNCIKRRCDSAKIKCECCTGDISSACAWARNSILGLFRTIHFCSNNFSNQNCSINFGLIAIHEWAHSCGWNHFDGKGVPFDNGKCQ